MPTVILERMGDIPIQFEGQQLAEVSTRFVVGKERNRWFEVQLFKTDGGRYVLAIGYRTQWNSEHDTDTVVQCGSPGAVRDELRGFDPLQNVVGYPAGPAYADKQRQLERMLRLDWAYAVKELFKETNEEFVEVIE